MLFPRATQASANDKRVGPANWSRRFDFGPTRDTDLRREINVRWIVAQGGLCLIFVRAESLGEYSGAQQCDSPNFATIRKRALFAAVVPHFGTFVPAAT